MAERRASERHKTFIQSRIYFNHRQSSMDCIIRDLTEYGGRLEFPEPTALPDTFEVYIPSKDEHIQARAIWHNGNDIGVRWLLENSPDPAPKPNPSLDLMADRVTKLESEVALVRKRLDAL